MAEMIPSLADLGLTDQGGALRLLAHDGPPIRIVRDLTPMDVALCDFPIGNGASSTKAGAPSVLRLRARHHRIAKLVADGTSDIQIGAIVSITAVRVSQLKADPAFQELVAFYQHQKDEIYFSAHEQLADLGIAAAEELAERLETTPDKFSHSQLLALMESAFDRSIAPKKTGPAAFGAGGSTSPSGGISFNISFVEPQPITIENKSGATTINVEKAA